MKTSSWLLALLLAYGFCGNAQAYQYCENVMVGMTSGAVQDGGGQPIYQQQCTWKYGAVAIDPVTRIYSSAWNYDDVNAAAAYVRAQCGDGCVWGSFSEDWAYMALSADDRVYGFSTVSSADAAARCQTAGGNDCETVLTAGSAQEGSYWVYGSVAYDVATGASGSSWNQRRRSDATAAAMESCGSATCWAYTFQGGNGAIAKSSDGKLFGGWSEAAFGLIGSVSKKAKKACKQATGEKDCEIVIKGPAAK